MGVVQVGEAFVDLTMPTAAFGKDIARGKHLYHGLADFIIVGNEKMILSFTAVGLAITAGITIPMGFAVSRLTRMASAAQEAMNLFQVVFQDSAADVIAWSESLGRAMGLSARKMRDTAGEFMLLFTSMDMNRDQAARYSKLMVQLGIDLTSLRNVAEGINFTYDKMKSALVGMSRPLQNIGIFTKDVALEEVALSMGITKAISTMSQQEKALLVMSAMLRQTSADQGDFIRTGWQLENVVRKLSDAWHDIGTALGSLFLPAIELVKTVLFLVIKPLAAFVGWLSKAPYAVRLFVGSVALAVAAIGPLVISLSLTTLGWIALKKIMIAYGIVAWLTIKTNAVLAAANISVAATATLAAKAFALLKAAMILLLLPFIKIIAIIAAVTVAITALGWLIMKAFGGGTNEVGKYDDAMKALEDDIMGVERATKGLNSQMYELSTLGVRAAKALQLAKVPQMPAATPAGPTGTMMFWEAPAMSAPLGPGSTGRNTGGAVASHDVLPGKMDMLIGEVHKLRDDVVAVRGLA